MWDEVAALSPQATAEEKQVALGLAALNGRAEALSRLLPLGVDLDAFTSGFYSHATPLHHAVWSGSLAAVKVLVEAGAKLTTRDKAEDATPSRLGRVRPHPAGAGNRGKAVQGNRGIPSGAGSAVESRRL
jgi:hypothetical protein